MKRSELFHPVVFDDPEWAEKYYNHNKKSIKMTGRRISGRLNKMGFRRGRVLDAGCGFGAVAIELAKAFPEAEIIGVDLSKPLLELGRNLVEKEGLSSYVTLREADVQDLSFMDDSFDLVVCTYMLHIVEKPLEILEQIDRIAKPNACIFITDLRRGSLAYFDKKLRTALSMRESRELIGQSKLREGKMSRGLFWWDYVYDPSK
jgi:ubiquinone/menaquinone biosynthesis C-methylase UbiE